jgi:DNA-binding response OmpR family regulator
MSEYQILLLGDGSQAFQTIARVLKFNGFTVKAAGNPEEALEALVRKNYDLIIAKLSRGSIDNLEILRRAQKANLSTKIMLITNHLDLAFPLEAYQINIDDYIIMPVSANEFQRRVKNRLEGLVVDLAPVRSFSRADYETEKIPFNPPVCESMLYAAIQA